MKKVIDAVNKAACSKESKIGDVLELIAGEAKECWCCSMVRGILVGAGTVAIVWAVTEVASIF